jgi:hypothetical protein
MYWSHRSPSTPLVVAAMLAVTTPASAGLENNYANAPVYAPTTVVLIVPSAAPQVAVVPQGSQVIIAPSAPPPAQVEVIAPPPSTIIQVVEWQPGHWGWNGVNWTWIPGQYAPRPQPGSVWVPGQWIQQSSGEYAWSPGHWV